MKNLIRIPLIMAISVLCCRSGRAQEFYRGEMFVTGQQFSLADGRLNIDLSVDFEGLRMPSDESLTVTPVLISGENEQALPAVLINGTEKQKVYQRQQEFTGNGRPSPIPAVVIRNDARMARSFRYRVAVPYQEWMKDALLLIRSQECACHGRQGSIYEDKIANRLNLPKVRTSVWDTDTDRKYLTWVNFIEPAPDKDTLHAVTGSIPYFGKEQRDKRERPLGELSVTKQNFEIYHRMRNALQDIRREAGTKLVKVKITGYGAPVGNLQKNEVDALVRSLKLKDYLRENRLTAGTPLEVTWISEDWDSIAALVKQSDMMFREATLDLIGNVDIDKGRERMLMRLADGKPYKYLAEKIFPEVMRVDYRIEYTRQPLDAAESEAVPYRRTPGAPPERVLYGGRQLSARLYRVQRCAGLGGTAVSRQPRSQHQRGGGGAHQRRDGQGTPLPGEVCHPAHGIQQHGHTLPPGRKPGQGGGIPHHGCGSRGETSRQSA